MAIESYDAASTNALLSLIDAPGGSKPSLATLTKLFKMLKQTKIRRPDVVALYGSNVLGVCTDDVEGWAMVEFIFLNCLEAGNDATAQAALLKILGKFGTPKVKPAPNTATATTTSTTTTTSATTPSAAVVLEGSERVQWLLGQYKESQGDWAAALAAYSALPVTHLPAAKRRACVLRSQRKYKECIAELLNLTGGIAYGDVNVWLELSDVYALVGDIKASASCLEEVVLLCGPSETSHIHNTRLAEMYYTIGGVSDLIRARQHYAIALQALCAPSSSSSSHSTRPATTTSTTTSATTSTTTSASTGNPFLDLASSGLHLRAVYGMLATCKCILSALQPSPSSGSGTTKASAATESHGDYDKDLELQVTNAFVRMCQEALQEAAAIDAFSSVGPVLEVLR